MRSFVLFLTILLLFSISVIADNGDTTPTAAPTLPPTTAAPTVVGATLAPTIAAVGITTNAPTAAGGTGNAQAAKTTTGTTGTNGGAIAGAIIAAIAVLGIIAGYVVYKKRRQNLPNDGPLLNTVRLNNQDPSQVAKSLQFLQQ
jgi:Na+/H+-translocating membrane pyrophosphatase